MHTFTHTLIYTFFLSYTYRHKTHRFTQFTSKYFHSLSIIMPSELKNSKGLKNIPDWSLVGSVICDTTKVLSPSSLIVSRTRKHPAAPIFLLLALYLVFLTCTWTVRASETFFKKHCTPPHPFPWCHLLLAISIHKQGQFYPKAN